MAAGAGFGSLENVQYVAKARGDENDESPDVLENLKL